MTDATDGDFKLLLGRALGKLEAIEGRLDRADNSRGHLHAHMDALSSKVDDVESAVAAVDTKVNSVAEDLRELKPEVELVKGLRYKAAGAIIVLGSLGALIGWALAPFVAALKAALLKLGG